MCGFSLASFLYPPAFLKFSQCLLNALFQLSCFFFMSIKKWFVTLLNLVFLFHFRKWLFLLFWIVGWSQLLSFWVPIILIHVYIFLFLGHFPASLVPFESTLPDWFPLFFLPHCLTCGMLFCSLFSYRTWKSSLSFLLCEITCVNF